MASKVIKKDYQQGRVHEADLFVEVILASRDDGHGEAAVVAAQARPGRVILQGDNSRYLVVCEVPEARLSVNDKTTDSDEVYFNIEVHIYTKMS